jgi:hypothetical protein
MAFNNHAKHLPNCRECRTHLSVAFSPDDGRQWQLVAHIEDEERDGVNVPSLFTERSLNVL